MKNKMKSIIVMLCVIFTFVSCTGMTDKNVSESSETEVDEENTVVWAVRSDARIQEDYVQKLNQLLKKKGHDLAVRFEYLEADAGYEKQEIYHNALREAINEGNIDIAYTDYIYCVQSEKESQKMGFCVKAGEMSSFLESGLFEPLTQWLQSSDGKKVYALYDEDVWKGASIHGEIYTIPDENSYVGQTPHKLISFQKDHVSKKLADSWDGSWDGLFQIMKQIKLQEGDCMLLGAPWLDSFEGVTEQIHYTVDDNGLVYNIQTGEISQPFSLEQFYHYLSFLHQCYQAGYLSDEQKMDSGYYDSLTEKILENGSYAIGFQSEIGDDDWAKDSAFVISGALGVTAVAANSTKKEKALELLTLLRTDDEIANTLVWGEGDASQILNQDGYVKDSYENSTDKYALGLNDGIFQSEDRQEPEPDMREYREKCEESSLRTYSDILGFCPDYSGLEKELKAYQNVLADSVDCWQENDFEGAYKKAQKKLEKVSRKLIKELNRQMREWKKKGEK